MNNLDWINIKARIILNICKVLNVAFVLLAFIFIALSIFVDKYEQPKLMTSLSSIWWLSFLLYCHLFYLHLCFDFITIKDAQKQKRVVTVKRNKIFKTILIFTLPTLSLSFCEFTIYSHISYKQQNNNAQLINTNASYYDQFMKNKTQIISTNFSDPEVNERLNKLVQLIIYLETICQLIYNEMLSQHSNRVNSLPSIQEDADYLYLKSKSITTKQTIITN